MRALFLSIGVVISAAITITFFISGRSGINPISANENFNATGVVLGIAEQAPEFSSVNNLLTSYNTLPSSEVNKFESSYSKPSLKSGAQEVSLAAKGGAAISSDDTVLFEQAGDLQLSIASLTKLATALTFLGINPGWDKIYEISADDMVGGGRINLFDGDQVLIKDLFYLSLVASDNSATKALVKSTGLKVDDFVKKMNIMAIELGLAKTKFVDPIGLNCENVSTAMELAKLAKIALENQEISQATAAKNYEFITQGGKKKIVYSTDSLLKTFPQNGVRILGGKTGYIEIAGYCFVGKFINEKGDEIISVVLGADNIYERFSQTKKLVDWVYGNYQWE